MVINVSFWKVKTKWTLWMYCVRLLDKMIWLLLCLLQFQLQRHNTACARMRIALRNKCKILVLVEEAEEEKKAPKSKANRQKLVRKIIVAWRIIANNEKKENKRLYTICTCTRIWQLYIFVHVTLGWSAANLLHMVKGKMKQKLFIHTIVPAFCWKCK